MRTRFAIAVALLASACGGAGATASSASPVPISTSAGTPTPIPTPTPTPAPASAPAPASDPTSLKVIFLGGSVTEGAFSTVPEKSYVGLLTSWLGTRYPHLTSRNLGLGGNGSEFGAYRIDLDLLDLIPDLAFIEFAVNDAGQPRAAIFAHTDAIIHKLRASNPKVRIVYVATTDYSLDAPQRAAGKRAALVQDVADVAAFEGIPFVDLGASLYQKVSGGEPVAKYVVDGVHPTDSGHQLYFEVIRDAISPALPSAQPSIAGGKLIDQSHLDRARLEPASAATGCSIGSLPLRYMDRALQCKKGESFVFRFSGTAIGAVRAYVRDGGQLSCTVDGQNRKTLDFFDAYALSYDRTIGGIDYRGLSPGDHVLACAVTDQIITLTQGQSRGNNVSIGYFMVSDEQGVTVP